MTGAYYFRVFCPSFSLRKGGLGGLFARRSEGGRICNLRDDVANWLTEKGILQMSYPTPREKMELAIEARERYVAVIDYIAIHFPIIVEKR